MDAKLLRYDKTCNSFVQVVNKILVAELDWKSTRQDVTHRTLNTNYGLLRNLAAGTHTSRTWQVGCIVYEVLQHHCPGTPVSFGRD